MTDLDVNALLSSLFYAKVQAGDDILISQRHNKDDPSASCVFIVQESSDEMTGMTKAIFYRAYESQRPAHTILHHTASSI